MYGIEPEKLYDESEVTTITRLKKATLRAMRIRGDGPEYVKIGRRPLYPGRDLIDFIQRQRRRSTSDAGCDHRHTATAA